MKFYRFDCRKYANPIDPYNEDRKTGSHLVVKMFIFDVDKETKCGYWIIPEYCGPNCLRYRVWISKTARKKHAYPSIKEAYDSFCRRRQAYRSILMARIADIEESLEKAFHLFEVESDKEKKATT